MMEITKLKIARHEYSITRQDRFLDNGSCVQLISQSKEISNWGRQANPVLSQRAEKEISKLLRVNIVNKKGYNEFSVDVL
jgi:hypothetical protein